VSALAAAIDIGSNSVKLLVGRPTGGAVEIVSDEVVVTRLSQGVDAAGTLNPQAAERTLDALRGFVATCTARGVARISAVGTAVLRDAADRADFLAACEGIGLTVEIIDGDTEAEVVRLAALHEVAGLPADAALIDIGGGSSELVWTGGRESTELGVVRLTERHVRADPPGAEGLAVLRKAVAQRLAQVPLPARAPALVGSSASCSLLARLELGLDTHQPERIHGYLLPVAAITCIAERLAVASHQDRLRWRGMDAGRADVLLAGAAVLEGAALRLGVDAVHINDRGTRYGVFHRAFTLASSPADR
jgi:exopolyphosphatase / guanosine-5'-triphosphate,3'-diphosphate pyrophosphatase